jgi:hypothetical protein
MAQELQLGDDPKRSRRYAVHGLGVLSEVVPVDLEREPERLAAAVQ